MVALKSTRKPDARDALYRDLVREHGSRIWRMAYRLTGDRDDAEDLAQETYCEAWRCIGKLRAPEAGSRWLLAILRHRAAHRLRRARSRPSVERALDERVDAVGQDELALDALARKDDIQIALDGLDPERRETFLLVFLEGWTCRETAERLDIPLGTVLSRIHRTRLELRRRLGRTYGAAGNGSSDPQRGMA